MMVSAAVASNQVVNTPTQNTVSQNTLVQTSVSSIAKEWELTDTEWKHYLNLMQGLSGHYYKNLSPPEVLGIQAESDDALRHFAEIAAKLEHDKLARELRFNVAFTDAAKKLYAKEPMIQPFDAMPFTPIPKN
jgi:integrating conjugative element protein (TIGR03759 family)